MRQLVQSLSQGLELSRLLRPENYLIFLPIVAITSALSNAGPTDLDLITTWLIANLISFTVLFLLLAGMLDWLRRQNREPIVKITGMLIFGTLLGAAKSFITFLAVWLLTDSESFLWVVGRTLQNLPLGFTVVGIVALMLVAKDNYLAQRELLIAHKVTELDSTAEAGSAAARLRSSLVSEAAKEIARVRKNLARPGNLEQLAEQAKELRTLAELTLRPLSHKIWAEQSLRLNDFSLRQLSRLGLAEKPFVPFLFLVLIVPGLGSWALEQYGLQQAALLMLQVSGILLLLQFATNRFRTKGALAGTLRLISVNILSALLSAIVLYPGETFSSEPQLGAMLASLAIWFTATSLMVSILSAGLRARADLRNELAAIYGKDQLERIIAGSISRYESRKVAQTLHSDVQNRLLSAALQLEQGKLATKEQLSAELSAIEAIVHELGQSSQRKLKSAAEEITAAANAWRGFLAIDLEIQGEISPWDSLASDLGQAVSEALSNAKRHGQASKVAISATAKDSMLNLEISDDGVVRKTTAPGLGFALFSSLSPTGFDLQQNDSGSKLELRIPAPQ